MSDISFVFTGMSIIGQSFTDAQVMAFVIAGHYDKEIKHALHFKFTGVTAVKPEDIEQQQVVDALEKLKNMHRRSIQDIFQKASEEDKLVAAKERLARMKELSAKHPGGTTAEIASKYGLSKAEVRRRKADGTLDSMIYGDAAINSL